VGVNHREGGSIGKWSLTKLTLTLATKTEVVSYANPRQAKLAVSPFRDKNYGMRVFAMLLVFSALLFGAYYFYLKKLPTTDSGTASTQAISLTGVRSDLLQIAQAERANVASNGSCASLAELISSNMLTMTRTERDGYSYSVECSDAEFNAIARHASAPSGSPIRYPNLAVDQNMQVHEVN
jgi:hypothetical protein